MSANDVKSLRRRKLRQSELCSVHNQLMSYYSDNLLLGPARRCRARQVEKGGAAKNACFEDS